MKHRAGCRCLIGGARVGYTTRLSRLDRTPGLAQPEQRQRINGEQNQAADRGRDHQDAEVGVHERGHLRFFRGASGSPEGAARQRRATPSTCAAVLRPVRPTGDLEADPRSERRTRDRERKLLRRRPILARIDEDYGYCEETGEAIGIQRLLARPTATLSIEAQERREMKQKLYGE